MALPFLAALTLALLAFGHPCDASARPDSRSERARSAVVTHVPAAPVPACGPGCPATEPPSQPAVEAPPAAAAPPRIAVNRAAPEELERLPGIGPRKAAALVEARGQRPFKRPSDLRRVKGFGARTVQRLAPLVTFE